MSIRIGRLPPQVGAAAWAPAEDAPRERGVGAARAQREADVLEHAPHDRVIGYVKPEPPRVLFPAKELTWLTRRTARVQPGDELRRSLEERCLEMESLFPHDVREDVRALCRVVSPKHAAEVYASFLRALLHAASGSEPHGALEPTWFLGPWLMLDPRAHPGLALDGALAAAQELGFENVTLMASVEHDAVTEKILVERERAGLRLVTQLEPSHSGDDVFAPAAVAETLHRVADDLRLGVLGEQLHDVDRWGVEAEGHPRAHALSGLIHVLLKLVDPRDVAMIELDQRVDHPGRLPGGALQIEGRSTPREADLLHWYDGMIALRRALSERRADALIEALRETPTLLFDAKLTCSLDQPESGELAGSSIASLLGGDPARIALALALLYQLPAVPMVYASEVPAQSARVHATLRHLHALERKYPALRLQRPQIARVGESGVVVERGPLVWLANLGDGPLVAHWDTTRFGGERLDARIELEPYAFVWRESAPRPADAPARPAAVAGPSLTRRAR